MPKGHVRFFCKVCQRHVSECGDLSRRGKCLDCGQALREANIYGLITHTGPFHDHWRRQMAASVGGVLYNDLQQTG